MEDRMQRQRFEKKFFVTQKQVPQIREYLDAHLVMDPYSAGPPPHPYAIHSIYLDTFDLRTYWATVHCEKRRFKLRVRFYNDDPNSPLFFEIKRRENECVAKRRAMVRRSAGAALLAGKLPAPEHLLKNKPEQLAALQEFCELMRRIGAHPMMMISYFREAWMHPVNNSVRVTLDRQVRGEPWQEAVFSTRTNNPVYPFLNTVYPGKDMVVLELKFTNRFPLWFQDLVEHFNLAQSGAAKYCGSVLLAGEAQVGRAAYRFRERELSSVKYAH